MVVKFGEGGRNICELSATDGGKIVKHVPPTIATISDAELVANANLLAASPELYRATKYFVEWVDDVWGSDALPEKALKPLEFAKAAIQKAEGKRGGYMTTTTIQIRAAIRESL